MSTPSHQTTSAILVGNAFVNQYYNVLHQQPESVHKFFTNTSSMMRDSSDSAGTMCIYRGQEEIHEKIMSLGFNSVKAEIKSVDSMESLQSGVIVMVTGFLSNRGEEKRSFVQSFFLAPQEKGYYVLSDIFRYSEEKHSVVPNDVEQPPAAPEENVSTASGPPEVAVESAAASEIVPDVESSSQSNPEANVPEIELRDQEGNEPPPEKEAIPESIENYDQSTKVDEIHSSPSDTPLLPSLPSHENIPTSNQATSVPSTESASKKSYASILSSVRASNLNRQAAFPTSNQPQAQTQVPSNAQAQPGAQSQAQIQSQSQSQSQPRIQGQSQPKHPPRSQAHPSPPLSQQSPPLQTQPPSQSPSPADASDAVKAPHTKPDSVTRTSPSDSTDLTIQPPDRSSYLPDYPKDNSKESNSNEFEVYADGGRSVYLKNLPYGLTASELFEEMKQFGTIKPEGIQVKNKPPNICFGFVEYEDVSSASNAIHKSIVLIRGQNVKIEKKLTPTFYKAGFRGRGFSRDKIRGRAPSLSQRVNYKVHSQVNPTGNATLNQQSRSPGSVSRSFQPVAPAQQQQQQPSQPEATEAAPPPPPPNAVEKSFPPNNNGVENYHKPSHFDSRGGYRGHRRGTYKSYGNRGGYVRTNTPPNASSS